MFHINFNVGQCTTLEARLCTASIYNLCSAKQADAFQRLLNVDKISITPCSIRTISNNFVKTFEKITVPIILFSTTGRKIKEQVTFHIIETCEHILLGYPFIFNGPKAILSHHGLTRNNGKMIKVHFTPNP